MVTLYEGMKSICEESGVILDYSKCLSIHCSLDNIDVNVKQMRNSLSHEKPTIYNSTISINIKNATVVFTLEEYLRYCYLSSLYYQMSFLLLAIFSLKTNWEKLTISNSE